MRYCPRIRKESLIWAAIFKYETNYKSEERCIVLREAERRIANKENDLAYEKDEDVTFTQTRNYNKEVSGRIREISVLN
jgi:hypothetical protein